MIRTMIGGLLAAALFLGCADVSEARHWRRRHHRTVVTEVVPAGTTVVRTSALGAPVVYQTYTTYDPYYRGGYRFYDRDGYRYYRDRNDRVMGRVILRAIGQAVR